MTGSPITFAGGERPSSAPTQTMSDTDTRGESRRTDDEAVTLPIPTSGLLSSPTQVGCHSARFTGGTPTPESHFNLAPLLSRGILSTGRSPRGQTTTHMAADGAVLPSGSPLRWPTPSHSLREFGHMPSLACSSGGNQSASGRRSSCSTGAVTVAGMLVGAVCKEESSEALLVDSGGSECFGERAPNSRRLWDQEHQALGAEAEPDVAQRLHLEDAESSAQILQIVSDGQELHTYNAGGDQYLTNICMGDDDAVALDQDHHPAEPGESSSLMHNPASCVTGDGVSAAVEEEEADEDASSRDAGCVIRGCPGGPKGEWEGPPWLTAEECAVTDAITQLQAVVSGLSEPYQRYIRERALELTRIIDENLQRQGLEPVTHCAVAGIATPSKKAATAAAALVLAVAASGTRWPYSTTPSGGDGSAGGGGGGGGAAASWPHMRSGRTADGGFHSTELAGHDSVTSADSVPFRGALGGDGGVMIGTQAQTLSYGGLATSGSCTLCFGSVLGNSQARPTESAEQISGAVSAQAASASQHALSGSRPTPRSRSYSSYYAQQQSQRRLASLRANGGVEPASASAMSSACSNPYGLAQPQDTSAGAVTSRRVPPRPPPRGLGCGLGQPRKLVSEGSRPTPNVHIHNLPYMMLPHSENPTPVGTARDHYRPGISAREHYISTSSAREHYSNISTASAREHYNSTASAREYYNPVSSYRRSRMSSQQSDQQQQHDQEELLSTDTSQTPFAQQKPHCVGAQRRGVGRPTSGNGAMLRPGSNASHGHSAKNAPTSGHVNIRPATVAPPNYQPPWQRPPPARTSASGSDRQRPADIAAELQQNRNRKAPPKAGLAKAAQGTVAQQGAQPSRGVTARKLPPAVQQQQHPRPASDYEDDISMKSARELSTSDAGSSYQQLLRRSGGARSSLVSLAKRVGGMPTGTPTPVAGQPPQSVPTPQKSRLSSFPIATSVDLTSVCATATDTPADALASDAEAPVVPAGPATADAETISALRPLGACAADQDDDVVDVVAAAFHSNSLWDNVLQFELPGQVGRHGFQPIASDEEDEVYAHSRAAAAGPIEPLQPDWQPLHTALTLDELQALAQQPGGRDAGGNLRLAQARFRHLSRGASQGGASDLALLSALTSGSLCGMPFGPETDEEPATAFAIIRRCGTRDRSSDRAASSTAATSSFGDLSRLLPAPAWRQAPSASDFPCPGRAAASTLAVAASVTSATTTAAAAGQGPPPAEVVDSTASGYSANVWDQGTAPDQLSRVRDSSFGSGAGGVRDSVIARDLTFGGALEVPERGGGDSAAAQLRNVLASLGGMHLIRGGSPVRPRYAAAGNSDSHASPQREPRNQHHVQQHRRRGEAAAPHDGSSGRGGKARRAAAGAASAAGNQRHKAAASKRTSAGALGTTSRAAAGGGKSRSTSRARGAKAQRAARGQPAAGRPPTGPQPPAPVLQQQQQQLLQHYPPPRPATPVPPPSPPPPQQSQTPVQFQMQLQLQQQQAAGASGVRRWTDSDPEDDDDDNDNEEEDEEEEMDGDEDEDQDALEDPSRETSASDCESAGNQSTPPRRQLHIRSPEDMPLSFVARQSAQPPRMGVMADAAATRSTFIDGPPVMAVVAATAATPTDGTLPSTAPGAWGPACGSSGSSQAHRLRPGPAALGQRLRGVAYAPLPSHRWAAGRTYTTTSIHTDGTTTTTTTVVTSPVSNRGACQQDCTPNILSPPRNYDRPWATPTRNRNGVEMWAANDVNSGSGYVLPTRSDSPRPPGAMGQADGDRDGSSILGSPTTTGGRPGRITARPALVHSSPQRVQLQRGCGGAYDGGRPQPGLAEGEVTGAGAVAADSRWGAPAGASGLASGIGTIHEEGPTFAAPRSGHSMPAATTAAHRGPPNSAQVGLMFHRQPHFAERPSQLNAAASMAAINGNVATMAPAAFSHAPGVGGVDAMPDGAAASAVGVIPARADRSQVSSFGAGSSLGSQTATLPDTKAEGVQTDTLDTMNDSSFNASNRSGRRSSEGSRRPSSPTALITSRTDGGRGYNVSGGGRGSGRPPMAAFRPSVSLRAAPTGTGGAQLALLHQAAWPGLRDPRVVDALATLEAGIAVLDPAPPPPPSSLGMTDLSEVSSGGGSSLPNGCFGLFNRSTPAVPKVPVVLVQEPVGQRPVLLRVHVADGAVELVLLRPRRGGGTSTSHGGPMGTHQPGAGEQRVRVAALSGLQPPLSAVLSPAAAAGANVFDDMADPSSRWVQLVAMDGGLMRLSACTPADHARLVLGLNAGLMAAMGAIGEETPLSVVPLCRGLGGVP